MKKFKLANVVYNFLLNILNSTNTEIDYQSYTKWAKSRNKIMLILIIFGIFYTLMAIAIYSLKNNIDNQSDLGNIISSFIYK